jgi:hypothetical protein
MENAANASRRLVVAAGVVVLATAFVGCRGCTYYADHTCVARVSLRAADGRTDLPCQIDLVPVGQTGPSQPQPAQLGRVNDYALAATWRSESRARPPSCLRLVVTCTGYHRTESLAFSFDVRATTCPTVELAELVLTPEPAERLR